MKKLDVLNNYIKVNFGKPFFYQWFGLARSVLALGTLLTLLINPIHNLFYATSTGDFVNVPFLDGGYAKYNFFMLLGTENMEIMRIIGVIILLAVISGYFAKLTSILHWYVVWSFMHMSLAVDGGDQIAIILTLYIIPLTFLDSRKNHWHRNTTKEGDFKLKNFMASIIYTIIRIQAMGIYLHAGIGKLFHAEWVNGTAVYYWFNHSAFGKPEYLNGIIDPVINSSLGVLLLTYGVIAFEIFLAMCLFMNVKFRKYVFPMAIFFHFSIILVHGIFSFFFSMACILIFYLIDIRSDFKLINSLKFDFKFKKIFKKPAVLKPSS